jgi:hypothetical protein
VKSRDLSWRCNAAMLSFSSGNRRRSSRATSAARSRRCPSWVVAQISYMRRVRSIDGHLQLKATTNQMPRANIHESRPTQRLQCSPDHHSRNGRRGRADKHESLTAFGVAQCVCQREQAAHGVTEDGDLVVAQQGADLVEVVAQAVERVGRGRSRLRPATAAALVVHELEVVHQRREVIRGATRACEDSRPEALLFIVQPNPVVRHETRHARP